MARQARGAILAAVAITLGLLVPLVLAEVVLQVSPVLSGLYTTEVDAGHPIGRFEPNRRFTYSLGPRFEEVVHGRTNNLGWVNDQDYDSLSTKPLLAVIGDSYVEALMVPYRQTLQGRLAAATAGEARVYSFGTSGAPLAHYLMLSDYARRTFHPSSEAIVVVGNDFDESLRRYKLAPGLYGFDEDSSGALTLRREDYHPSRWKRIIRKSALVRYLIVNLKVDAMWSAWRSRPATKDSTVAFAGNVRARADSERVRESRRAVDAFLAQLPARSGLAPACLSLVVDGVRPQLYDARTLAAGDSSYFGQMRTYLLDRARLAGYVIVDMQPAFIADYRTEHRAFEYPSDGHWNALGHQIAAQALVASLRERETPGQTSCWPSFPNSIR